MVKGLTPIFFANEEIKNFTIFGIDFGLQAQEELDLKKIRTNCLKNYRKRKIIDHTTN